MAKNNPDASVLELELATSLLDKLKNGEMLTLSAHESQYLTKQNYNIKVRKGGAAGERDALNVESRTRIQYINGKK